MKKTIFFIIVIIFTFYANSVLAGCSPTGLEDPSGAVELCNPLGNDPADASPQALIGTVINGILGIVGSIALVMFIYGGFLWMTAAGNQESVTKGKNVLIWATLGIIIIFMSYALVNFVFTNIGAAS